MWEMSGVVGRGATDFSIDTGSDTRRDETELMGTSKNNVVAQVAEIVSAVQGKKGRGIRVALDGRDAAGKTTFTDQLDSRRINRRSSCRELARRLDQRERRRTDANTYDGMIRRSEPTHDAI